MFNKRKYVLEKTAKYACCTIMILSIFHQSHTIANTNIPYTEEDLINNKTYVTELHQISQETPIFKNKDLYNELITQGIDLTSLKDIKSLTITNTLLNNDFSDLKYFPNLSHLHIENNDINLENIKYNTNLLNLELSNCSISNITSIPNSIYNLSILDTTLDNNLLTIPYNTKYLTLNNVPFNYLHLKNPSSLKKLSIVGNCFLDINSLIDCNNLEQIRLNRVANVSNSDLLPSLPSLKTIELDDYAPIWLTKETLQKLNINNQQLHNEILSLDILAQDITENCKTEEEQIKAITTHILTKLSYDEEFTKQELNDYNNNPISSALNNKENICINYASLFTALCNRVGIDTYQIYSSNHTWNMIYKGKTPSFIDLTMLDTQTIVKVLETISTEELPSNQTLDILSNNQEQTLYHYNITLEELLQDPNLNQYSSLPNKDPKISNNIGYIKYRGIAIEFANKLYFIEYSKLAVLITMIAILSLFLTIARKDLNRPLLMSPEDTALVLKKDKQKLENPQD